MGEAKSIIWAGFDVGKASFVAALDEATASERRKVTSLPCREFKRNQDEVKKLFPLGKRRVSRSGSPHCHGDNGLLFATLGRMDQPASP